MGAVFMIRTVPRMSSDGKGSASGSDSQSSSGTERYCYFLAAVSCKDEYLVMALTVITTDPIPRLLYLVTPQSGIQQDSLTLCV
jgi:hypothetical protein